MAARGAEFDAAPPPPPPRADNGAADTVRAVKAGVDDAAADERCGAASEARRWKADEGRDMPVFAVSRVGGNLNFDWIALMLYTQLPSRRSTEKTLKSCFVAKWTNAVHFTRGSAVSARVQVRSPSYVIHFGIFLLKKIYIRKTVRGLPLFQRVLNFRLQPCFNSHTGTTMPCSDGLKRCFSHRFGTLQWRSCLCGWRPTSSRYFLCCTVRLFGRRRISGQIDAPFVFLSKQARLCPTPYSLLLI
jgi:hypothetical protein